MERLSTKHAQIIFFYQIWICFFCQSLLVINIWGTIYILLQSYTLNVVLLLSLGIRDFFLKFYIIWLTIPSKTHTQIFVCVCILIEVLFNSTFFLILLAS